MSTSIKSGRLEVAIAVARTSHLVSVDPTQIPPTSIPPDLFVRTFNDDRVGIDDEQMRQFKERLKLLLPEISADVDKVPENSNQVIGDVAFFIRVALMKEALG